MRPSNNLENKALSDILKSSASVYESSDWQFWNTTGKQQVPNAFEESRFILTLLTILRVTSIFCCFRLFVEGQTDKEIPESSRLEFIERCLANNFALSDAEDSTSGPLTRGVLEILRAKFHGTDGLFYFISLKQKSLAASRTLLQQLLACLNFTLDSDRLFFWYKPKSDFYELWQQHKQMKTMEMSNAWPDSYIEGYIYIYIYIYIYTQIYQWMS